MPQPKPLQLYTSVIFAMMCFSLSFVWFKQANATYGPMTIVLFRLAMSAAILFVFTKASKKLRIPDKQDLKRLLLLAFFEPFLYFMGESHGLRLISPTVGAVIIATIPLVAPFAGYLFHQEKITLRHMLGMVISFMGVILVVFEIGKGLTASPLGVLLEFCAVLAAVGYTVVLHRISDKMNNISIIFYQGALGFAYFLPFWLICEAKSFIHTPYDASAMLAILKLAIFASTVAFIFFTYSVRHMGVTRANMFVNIVPVCTALFSWMVLKEPLTAQKWLGIAIVISGLFFAQMQITKKHKGPDPIPRT